MEHLIFAKWFWVAVWCAAGGMMGCFLWLLFAHWLPLQREIEAIEDKRHES